MGSQPVRANTLRDSLVTDPGLGLRSQGLAKVCRD